MVYKTLSEIDFSLEDLPSIPDPRRVLLTTPEHFDVQYVINPHMESHVGSINKSVAMRQWQELHDAYHKIGIQTVLLEGVANLPDMVFCANQTLPFYHPKGKQGIVLSRMHAVQRRPEVKHFARFFEKEGYEVLELPTENEAPFEGMGDAIWHPGNYLLWGGYGFRTQLDSYDFISKKLEVNVLAIRLEDPDFYHLDTCFSVLDRKHVLIYPGAFDEEGLKLICHFFPSVLEVPEREARHQFACNAHCPDGQHVFIHKGCKETNRQLQAYGFMPIELDTSEFLKSGGSVFCMKLMFW